MKYLKVYGWGKRMKRLIIWTAITGAILMSTLTASGATPTSGSTTKTSFGKTPEGEAADLYVLTNKNGNQVAITNYGGAVVSIKVPDREGKIADVVLGYDSAEGYANDKSYLGAHRTLRKPHRPRTICE